MMRKQKKRNIVRAAARLIKADIKNIDTCRDFYPDPSELRSLEKNVAYVPQSLRILLQETFSGKSCDLEVASIGQSIVQLTRPKAIVAPIQYGLAVQMHSDRSSTSGHNWDILATRSTTVVCSSSLPLTRSSIASRNASSREASTLRPLPGGSLSAESRYL